MSGKRSDPDSAREDELFREAMRDVKPIARAKRADAPQRKPPARARFTAADRALVLVESMQGVSPEDSGDAADALSFRRAGVQDRVLKKLRRGEYRVEAVCDLHGLRVEEAKSELRAFLADALARGMRCVRVIHGKGMNSGPRGPVLKVAVNMVLRKTAPVLAFTSARRVDGGTGAINVLLGTL